MCMPARDAVVELRVTLERCWVAGSKANSMKPSWASRSQMSSRHSRNAGSEISACPAAAAPGAADAAAAAWMTPQTCLEAAWMALQKSAGRASRMLARASSWYPSDHSRWVKSCAHALHRWRDDDRGPFLSKRKGPSLPLLELEGSGRSTPERLQSRRLRRMLMWFLRLCVLAWQCSRAGVSWSWESRVS